MSMVSLLIKICHVLQFVLVEYVPFQRAREAVLSIWVILGPPQGILCIIVTRHAVNGVELGLLAETGPFAGPLLLNALYGVALCY